MGDPSVPDEQEDIERIIAEDDPSHGSGDVSNLPESDFDDIHDGGDLGDLLNQEEDVVRDSGKLGPVDPHDAGGHS